MDRINGDNVKGGCVIWRGGYNGWEITGFLQANPPMPNLVGVGHNRSGEPVPTLFDSY